MNPYRYAIIYNSKYDNNDNVADISIGTAAVISPPKPNQNHYYNEYHEGILEIAKGFLNILLNQLVDKMMVAAVKADVKENEANSH
jgi:hypothetical protein